MYFIDMFSDIKGEVFVLLMNHKCWTLQPFHMSRADWI